MAAQKGIFMFLLVLIPAAFSLICVFICVYCKHKRDRRDASEKADRYLRSRWGIDP